MPRVSEEHREERRRQILDGARTVFARHGYFGATVVLLEDEIGLSRGAIFSYYASKFDLFTALAAVDRQRIGELWLEGGYEAVVRYVGQEDPAWIGVYLEAGRMLRTDARARERWDILASNVVDRIAQRYVESQTKGEIRSDMSAEAIMQWLGVILDGLATHRGAGFPIDVDGTLEFVRSALGLGGAT
jgi:TetR/AcrR family transcriptional regulator, transcriptional repressor of aconitase